MQKGFSSQQDVQEKIMENKNMQVEAAIKEMQLVQKKYDDYVKYESVEAYFEKFQFLVDRNDPTKTAE